MQLNGAAVELFEDQRAHDKSFQPPEGHCPAIFTTVLVCLTMIELEAFNRLQYSPVDVNGGVLCPPFPVRKATGHKTVLQRPDSSVKYGSMKEVGQQL